MTAVVTARPLPLLRRELADSWRGLIGWGLGFTAAASLYLPLYSAIGANPEFTSVINSMPPELIAALNFDAIASGPGYTQGTVYALIGFVLMTVAATGWGAAVIAGDEERGTLELVLAHGVSRTSIVLERFAAVVLKLITLVLWLSVLVLALNGPSQLGLDIGGVLAGGVAILGSGVVTASFALMAGAITGRRSVAVGSGAGIAIAGYVFTAVANQSSDLQWLYAISPFHWSYGSTPLANGFDSLLLLPHVLAAVAVLVSVIAFRRRDVGI